MTLCFGCGSPDDELDEDGLCPACVCDADLERAAIYHDGEHSDPASASQDGDYCDDEHDSAVWRCASCGCPCGGHSCCHRPRDEQASARSSRVDAAVPPTDPVPLGPAGGAALGGGESVARRLVAEAARLARGEYLPGGRAGDAEHLLAAVGAACRISRLADEVARMEARLDAHSEARELLLALSERDSCPDCGADPDWIEHIVGEVPQDYHAVDCGIATWLRLYGSAP